MVFSNPLLRRRLGAAGVAGAALLPLAGCGKAAPPVAAAAPPEPPATAFLGPPTPQSARRLPAGEVELAGHAPAGAVVSLRHPDGQVVTAVAGGDGAWRLRLPAAAEPRLYALSLAVDGRTIRGEGALFQGPGPAPPAVLLRAGAPSAVLDDNDGAVVLETIDFDRGGLAAAGRAPPRSDLRLSVDDRPAGAGKADAQGRFALMAVQVDLKPGAHLICLEGAGRVIEAKVDTTPAAPPEGQPYGVRRVDGGWRVDWATPGGGAQSTVALAPGLFEAGG